MNTLIQYVEFAALVLTIAGGVGGIVANVWGAIDHGHPDARRAWLLRAVHLALVARGELETVLGPKAITLEAGALKDIAATAETYLATHGLHIHLDASTLRLILADLRQATSG